MAQLTPAPAALPEAIAIVRRPDPAHHTDADVLAACAFVLANTRAAGVERHMAELLQRAMRPN